jgi:hypothetical protein
MLDIKSEILLPLNGVFREMFNNIVSERNLKLLNLVDFDSIRPIVKSFDDQLKKDLDGKHCILYKR